MLTTISEKINFYPYTSLKFYYLRQSQLQVVRCTEETFLYTKGEKFKKKIFAKLSN